MRIVLLLGAVLNGFGGVSIVWSMFASIPYSFEQLPNRDEINPSDYPLFRLFTAGTALCFSALYFYLYVHPQYTFPFLIFGMALKYWAFVVSLIAYVKFRVPKRVFIGFGCVNLMFAILFSSYLLLNRH
jgi:hypothetical protein